MRPLLRIHDLRPGGLVARRLTELLCGDHHMPGGSRIRARRIRDPAACNLPCPCMVNWLDVTAVASLFIRGSTRGNMGRHSRHFLWHRAAAGLAAAGLTTLGLAGAAHAEDAPLPVIITGPERVDLALDGVEDEPGQPQISLGLTGPGEHDPDDDVDPEPIPNNGYKITIDASTLAGFAKVDLPCPAEGLVAVCDESSLYPGDSLNPRWGVRLDLKDTSKAGDFGKIKVTGEGEGLTFTEHTVDVLVGGPEFRMKKLPAEPKGFAAGDTYKAPLGFRNTGSMAADGVVLRFGGSRGDRKSVV